MEVANLLSMLIDAASTCPWMVSPNRLMPHESRDATY